MRTLGVMNRASMVNRLRLRLLPIAVATVFATTAIPVELRGLVCWSGDVNPFDMTQNLVLYVPLGAALWRRPSWVVLTIAAFLSSAIEVAQLWMINRDPSPVDVVANAAGAFVGALGWRRAGLGAVHGAITPGLGITELAVLAVLAALILLAWGVPAQSSALANWNPSYPLQLGNEATGDRPWHGVIHRLMLRPTVAPLPHTTGPEAAENSVEVVGPVVFSGDQRIVTPEPVSRAFADAVRRENSFAVVAQVTITDIVQEGPARIVSFSADPFQRNFDLGQQGRSIVFRVRTPVSGLNGEDFRAETTAILRSGEETLIAAGYDGAVARIHVNGRLHARRNIAAAGCSVAVLCDSAVSIAWAFLGAVTTLMALAFSPWSERWHTLGIALVASAGTLALPRLLQVGAVPLETQPLAQLMAVFGAFAVAIAVEPPHDSKRAAAQ